MKTRIGLSLLLATVLGVFCLLTPRVSASGAAADSEKTYPVTYRLGDLPVWTKDGQFQPKLILSFIQTTISREGWEAFGGQSTMAPYPQGASVVISTTSETHDKIVEFFKQYR